jgi:hypothetical protein
MSHPRKKCSFVNESHLRPKRYKTIYIPNTPCMGEVYTVNFYSGNQKNLHFIILLHSKRLH